MLLEATADQAGPHVLTLHLSFGWGIPTEMLSHINKNHCFEEATRKVAVKAPLVSVCRQGRVLIVLHISFVFVFR